MHVAVGVPGDQHFLVAATALSLHVPCVAADSDADSKVCCCMISVHMMHCEAECNAMKLQPLSANQAQVKAPCGLRHSVHTCNAEKTALCNYDYLRCWVKTLDKVRGTVFGL